MSRPRTLPDFFCLRCGDQFRGRNSNANRYCSRACSDAPIRSAEFLASARAFWDKGYSMTSIGMELGVSKNVIAGIAHRNDFPARRPSAP